MCSRRDAVTLTFESQHLPTSLPIFYIVFFFEVQRTHYPTPVCLQASPARPQDGVHEEMLTHNGRSPGRSVHIEDGKAGRHYDEDIISAYYPPGILERLLAHLLQCELSSVFMFVVYFQTPATFESQLSIGVGSAVDSSRTKARLFVNWRPRERLTSYILISLSGHRLVRGWVFRRDRRGRRQSAEKFHCHGAVSVQDRMRGGYERLHTSRRSGTLAFGVGHHGRVASERPPNPRRLVVFTATLALGYLAATTVLRLQSLPP